MYTYIYIYLFICLSIVFYLFINFINLFILFIYVYLFIYLFMYLLYWSLNINTWIDHRPIYTPCVRGSNQPDFWHSWRQGDGGIHREHRLPDGRAGKESGEMVHSAVMVIDELKHLKTVDKTTYFYGISKILFLWG